MRTVGVPDRDAIARGTSFLKEWRGAHVFLAEITIIDEPQRARRLRSKPFDGEGIANRRRALVDRGVLTSWPLDLRSARQMDLERTGHAARGAASPPAPAATNVWIEPRTASSKALIDVIKSGAY
jgi:PmbA protein